MNIRKRNKYKAIRNVRKYRNRKIINTISSACDGFKIVCSSFNNALGKTIDNLRKTFSGMKLS